MRSEIGALISLLDDDSPTVLTAVTERLRALGDEAVPALRRAGEDGPARTRGRARELIANIERQAVFRALVELAATPAPDLEEGAMLLASIHDPDLDRHALAARLDEMAASTRAALEGASPGRERLERFLGHLHGELAFKGDDREFGSWANNFLDAVIDRRRGIPITLILIYILVGRRIGLVIDAINTPFRAIAFFREGAFETYVDAFSGGRLLGYHDCIELLIRAGFRGAAGRNLMKRMSSREILARMTRNLINFCATQGRELDGRDFVRFGQALEDHRQLDGDRLVPPKGK